MQPSKALSGLVVIIFLNAHLNLALPISKSDQEIINIEQRSGDGKFSLGKALQTPVSKFLKGSGSSSKDKDKGKEKEKPKPEVPRSPHANEKPAYFHQFRNVAKTPMKKILQELKEEKKDD